MRELFFAHENYTLSGEGRFDGVFHLYKGGRSLTGGFESDELGLDVGGHDYRFPTLKGKLAWLPDRFDVTDTTSQFYGGTTRLRYSIAPLGKPQPARAKFDAEWQNVDLAAFTDFLEMQGIRLAGPLERTEPSRVAARPFPRARRRRRCGIVAMPARIRRAPG